MNFGNLFNLVKDLVISEPSIAHTTSVSKLGSKKQVLLIFKFNTAQDLKDTIVDTIMSGVKSTYNVDGAWSSDTTYKIQYKG